MSRLKRGLALVMTLCMMLSMVPMVAPKAEAAVESDEFLKVFHLDCGRKYFSVDQVKELIDAISNVGYSHMELAIGNDGLRLLLNDMDIVANGTTYNGETIKSGIKSGNAAYSHSGEWLEDDMDDIIAYANTKGIQIIPLVNNPGHMDSILAAMSACGLDGNYKTSVRTVDLENEDAVAFTQALVMKYAEYFASKGCKYFNIGADEYANDVHEADSTGMGFGYLVTNKKYGNFITYVNTLVGKICALGMTPIAFNDGIYYNENTSFGTFDNRLMIAAWSGGWGGIKPASTTFLQSKGHQILNTNERWYYVLGRAQSANNIYCYENALSNAKSESVTTVTDREQGVTSAGAMQCVWCDVPSVNYETYKAKVMTLINTFAESNPTYFTGPNVVVPETVTKTDETTGISASAPGLSELIIDQIEGEANLPVIEGVSKILAYDVQAFAGDESYTGETTISIPVPTDWTRVRGGVLASASGEEVLGIEGKLEKGMFTFTVPHLSEVVVYATEYDEEITLQVGDTYPVVVQKEDLSGPKTPVPDPVGVVSVTAEYEKVPGETIRELGSTVSMNSDDTYDGLIKSGDYYLVMDEKGAISSTTDINEATEFIVTRTSGWGSTNYTIYNGTHYLSHNNNSLTGEKSSSFSSYWSYSNGFQYGSWGSSTTYRLYCDNNGWKVTSSNVTNGNLYAFTETTNAPKNQSTVTIEAIAPGETLVEIDGVTYKIIVSKRTESATIAVGENKTYKDPSSTQPVVEDDSVVSAEIKNGILTITAKAVDTTTVTTDNGVYTITVEDFDISKVPPLCIEYWITNHRVEPDDQEVKEDSDRIWIEIPAAVSGIWSEGGVALNSLVAASGIDKDQEGNALVFWKGVSLDTNEHKQTKDPNDNETFNGADFTNVRYWNRTWQVLTNSGWSNVTDTTQLVAYYLQKTNVTNSKVIQTETVDWGEIYGKSGYSDTNFVALDFTIQYEDGTRNPDEFAVSGKTMMFHCDYKNALNATVFKDNSYPTDVYYRRLSTIKATNTSNYEVYMITLTPNDDNVTKKIATKAGAFSTINYNGTEKVVWVDDVANLGKFEDTNLQHADFYVGGDPVVRKVDIYNQQSVLVTYYVRAKVTEDSLTVHYIDETSGSGNEFYRYNIAVQEGTLFNKNIALPDAPNGIGNLKNGIVQTIDSTVKQTVSSDLKTLPAVAEQYLYSDYTCTRVERSANGKEVYLYYTFDSSLTFVADFGLPIVISAQDLNEDLAGKECTMSVTGSVKYGELSSSGTSVTYKPTKVMQGSEQFKVRVSVTGSGSIDYRVYIVPATTVYYEEGFAADVTNSAWNPTNKGIGTQAAEVAGEKVNNYGYDPAYSTIGASNGTGAESTANNKVEFTFVGTGVDIYTNNTTDSGALMITVMKNGALVKLMTVDTKMKNGSTDATTGQAVTAYNVPVASIDGLEYGEYTVGVAHVKSQDKAYHPVSLDGFRVYGTLNESSLHEEGGVYYKDHEDNPVFIELRDKVLAIQGVTSETSGKYADQIAGNVYSQIFSSATANESTGAVIIAKDNSMTNGQLKDLLDNGPKNEIYLQRNQALVFNITTNREVQIGLRGLNAATTCTINGNEQTIASTTDMFYTVFAAGQATNGKLVTITNNGGGILAITDLKICDDPNAALGELTEEDLTDALVSLGYSETPGKVKLDVTDAHNATLRINTEKDGFAVVAFYNEKGRQVGVKMLSVKAGTTTHTIRDMRVDLTDCEYKVFLLNNNFAPVYSAKVP